MKLSLKKVILIAGLVVLLFLFLAVFKLTYSIKSPCRFVAQSEWSLTQLEPDKLSVRLVRNDSSKVKSFTLLQFDRQDFIQFSLASNIQPGLLVQKGQIIGNVISSENQLRLVDLLGQLKKAKANLSYISTGEKPPVQAEARQALKYTQAECAAFLPQLNRTRQLYKQNLISKGEWEIAEATHDLNQLNIALQEAKMKVVQSGERIEAIRVIEADITNLENQIGVMQEKLSFETIKSPIYGIVTDPGFDSVLCHVSQLDTVVVQIPIRSEQRKYLKLDQVIKIYSFDEHLNLTGKVDMIGNHARIINSRPMFVVSSLIENPESKLLPGMAGYAKIYCDKVSILKLIQRAWKLYVGAKFLF